MAPGPYASLGSRSSKPSITRSLSHRLEDGSDGEVVRSSSPDEPLLGNTTSARWGSSPLPVTDRPTRSGSSLTEGRIPDPELGSQGVSGCNKRGSSAADEPGSGSRPRPITYRCPIQRTSARTLWNRLALGMPKVVRNRLSPSLEVIPVTAGFEYRPTGSSLEPPGPTDLVDRPRLPITGALTPSYRGPVDTGVGPSPRIGFSTLGGSSSDGRETSAITASTSSRSGIKGSRNHESSSTSGLQLGPSRRWIPLPP